MLYTDKDTVSNFAIPLLEFVTVANHGYLFKITSDYSSENVTYHIPTVTNEDIRFTYFEHNFEIVSGQYTYEVYDFNTDTTPTNETGLNRIAIGRLIVVETETNNIYL